MPRGQHNAYTAFRWIQPQDGFRSSLIAIKLTRVLRTTGTISTGFVKAKAGKGEGNLILISVIPRNQNAFNTYQHLISTNNTRTIQVKTYHQAPIVTSQLMQHKALQEFYSTLMDNH